MRKHLCLLLCLLGFTSLCLAASSATRKVVDVPNSSFDMGLEGWHHGTNATAVTEGAINGQCARMIVTDPLKDAVYITRLVPCVPSGRYDVSCKIRTEGVLAKQGKMSSVGACLIVEWADKNGKWIEPGAYSASLYGDKDWTLAECKGMRAPENAGFLSIFLALRGSGKAWYEDFAVVQLEESIQKVTPANGETLDTNAPELQWRRVGGVDTYAVEISSNADFPEDSTQKYLVDVALAFQLPSPLPPGKWFWRVTADGYPDANPFTFQTTVPADQDKRPPLIQADHARLLRQNDRYVFQAEGEVSVADQDDPSVQFDIATEGNLRAVVPQMGWKNGYNAITIQATGANGVIRSKDIWIACAPKPERSVVIDQKGHYSENGKTIFPLGIYAVETKDMPMVREAGFEIVHNYAWEFNKDDNAAKRYLDACTANDLRAFIGFDRGPYSGNGIVQGNFEHIARRVSTFADHPAIFCWYLFDEPEIVAYYVPPKLLTAFAELIRKLDPYHPVVMTTWGSRMNSYRKCWDTHWTQCYDTPDEVVKMIDGHRRLLLNASPITLLIHCYDRVQHEQQVNKTPVDWENFQPDYAWMRANALLGIIKQVNGLWWWWFAKDSQEWVTAAQNPATWKNLCKVVAEVRSLRKMVNAEGPVQTGVVESNGAKVEWMVKDVQGHKTMLAVNTSTSPVEITIAPQDMSPVTLKLGRYESYVK
ncbi:MAG: DUF4962 domain-containing protein [Lentisphaeria bacterium]|nr:DUF4962 domain-containing protein [Lentisphaeria bacterium]